MDTEVRVARKTLVAEDIMELRLAALSGELESWNPGAHIDVHLPNWLDRSYSLCGDVDDTTQYRIAVRREELSRGGSEYIHDFLRTDGRLVISRPRDTFGFDPSARAVFIAGGIGITPILPMLRTVGDRGTLIYAGRRHAGMAYVDEATSTGADVRIHAGDRAGRPDLHRYADEFADAERVYTCGPEPLIEAVKAAFDSRGYDVRVERFRPSVRTHPPNRSFDIYCARARTTLTVSAAETALEALSRHGIGPKGGCREGVCASCVVRILGGDPDHRDDVGAAEGEFYPCVSRAFSETLVLDV